MLTTLEHASQLINVGQSLLVAGDQKLLDQLPKGNWIGGTIPYFVAENGGEITRERIFITAVPEAVKCEEIRSYAPDELPKIGINSAKNALNFIIIPATSDAHVAYAQDAPQYEQIFEKPTVGWISGVHLDDLGRMSPKIYNGKTGQASEADAIVMHTSVPAGQFAEINIINVFEQGDGDGIEFETEGFNVKNCLINGESVNFATYLQDNKIDTKLPLVANYHGSMINSSFQTVNAEDGTVDLYAPVFKHTEYKIAAPVEDYVAAFLKAAENQPGEPIFSCNCILNFLYSELENKKTGNLTGPITFGEIAYQLLNQTLVSVSLKNL